VKRSLLGIAVVASLLLGSLLSAPASTTGGIRGRAVSAATNAPVAGATVTVTSPSQTAVTTTDATGALSFLALTPDS